MTALASVRVRSTAGPDRDAVRDMVPVLLGLLPFAAVVGVTMSELGIAPLPGLLASWLLFAGSAQLAVLAILGTGAGVVAAVVGVAVVNARLLLYGAALAQRFRAQPGWFRWLGPHTLVDQTYALASARPELDEPDRFRRYWLTAGAALSVVWLAGIGAGMAVGPVLPADSPLDVSTPALFAARLVPRLRDRGTAAAAVTAALATAGFMALPSGAGLLAGIAAGAAAAAVTTRKEVRP